jgi:MerR family transcriptional regulator, copper efflux regulator
MRIGAAAQRAGVTPRTIRYYESLGLMGPDRRASGRFRQFTEDDLERLAKIELLKELGLSLEEVGSVIDLYFAEPIPIRGKRKTLEILRQHLAETDHKLSALTEFRRELIENIQRVEQHLCEMEQQERTGKPGCPCQPGPTGRKCK